MGESRSTLLILPNLMTLGRVALVPVLVAAFYLPAPAAPWATFALFALAGVTDFADGWLARARGQTSDFGRFLDPIADKILVAAALFMMAASGWLPGLSVIAAVIIIGREFVVSGLREFLAGRIAVPVSRLAKWKTASQMIAIALLLVAPGLDFAAPFDAASVAVAGEVLLWIAATLTVITGAGYLRAGLARFDRPGD